MPFQSAQDEPVLCDPEIHGPLDIDNSFQFLLLFSRSLADCLSQVASIEEGSSVVHELCKITLDQFQDNTTMSGVAQSVIDKVVRLHREQFDEMETATMAVTSREDLGLIVRNFNAKLAVSRRKKSGPGIAAGGGLAQELRRAPAEDTITSKTTTTESSDVFVKNVKELPMDENGRIKPYVDFGHFYSEWNKFKASQHNGTAPRPTM